MKNLYNLEKYRVALQMVEEGFFYYEDGRIFRAKQLSHGNAVLLPKPLASTTKTSNGYYRLYCKGRTVYEHVLVYVIFHGLDSLNEFQCIDHLNGVKTDNRIENLEGVSVFENSRRAEEMGLVKRTYGEINGMCRLTASDISEIKKLRSEGLLQREIATKMGVTQGHISAILSGKRRKYA